MILDIIWLFIKEILFMIILISFQFKELLIL